MPLTFSQPFNSGNTHNAMFYLGSKYGLPSFLGVKICLDQCGSELLVHFRVQDVLYDLLSFFSCKKSSGLESPWDMEKAFKKETIFLALHFGKIQKRLSSFNIAALLYI